MTRSKSKTTIHDIARMAGVGVGTVSRVLNDHPSVDPATRKQIQAIISQSGYRPKSAAQTLRTRKTHEIGLITDEIASTPFAVDIIRGAQDAAWTHGKIVVLVNTNNNAQVLEAAIDTMLDRDVEGIIYAAMYHQKVRLPANINQTQAVLVDCFNEERSLPSVVPDEVQGGRDATQFLLSKGHRRIGFLNDVNPIEAHWGRLAGYKQALSAAGIAFDPQLVTHGPSMPAGGYAAAQQVFEQEKPPDAIFCFNDRMAMGAYDYLRKAGLRVPEDVAVIGFDNQEVIAAHLHPGLTTMQLPHYAMGQWAVNHLVSDSKQEANHSIPQLKFECPLITRSSV